MHTKYKFVLAPLVIALLSVMILPVFTFLVAAPMFTRYVSDTAGREALRLAHHLKSRYTDSMESSSQMFLSQEVREDIHKEMDDFDLLMIRVFDNHGKLAYSTMHGDIKDESKDRYFRDIISSGEVVSIFLDSDELDNSGWPLAVTHVVETYVPIVVEDNVIGVYEIYYDVSGKMSEMRSARVSLFIVLGTITVLLLVLVAVSTQFTLRNAADRQKAEEALRQALADKDLLFMEMHHRVKNNLSIAHSLLSLQADRVVDESVRELFAESANRLISLSLVHEMLYKSSGFKEINFGAYLRSLVSTIFENLTESDSGITLEIEADDIVIETDKVITCGLIVNELVSNSIKHAFPEGGAGTIWVGFKRIDGKSCVLSVKDDGVGLPKGVDVMEGKTLGVQIISGLVSQLEGSLDATSNICDGQGACFSISFNI